MCSEAPASEKELFQKEASFASELQSHYSEQYKDRQDILAKLQDSMFPILAAGSNQPGYSAQERAALNTQAINSTAGNYANAARAVGGQLSGRGGDSGLLSGVDAQIKGALAAESAKTLSDQQLGITASDYATGRDQYNRANAGMLALSGQYDPTGYAELGTRANQQAYGQAKDIQAQKGSIWKTLGGLAKAGIGIGASILTGGMSGLAGPALSAGSNLLSRSTPQSGAFTSFSSGDYPSFS